MYMQYEKSRLLLLVKFSRFRWKTKYKSKPLFKHQMLTGFTTELVSQTLITISRQSNGVYISFTTFQPFSSTMTVPNLF